MPQREATSQSTLSMFMLYILPCAFCVELTEWQPVWITRGHPDSSHASSVHARLVHTLGVRSSSSIRPVERGAGPEPLLIRRDPVGITLSRTLFLSLLGQADPPAILKRLAFPIIGIVRAQVERSSIFLGLCSKLLEIGDCLQ